MSIGVTDKTPATKDSNLRALLVNMLKMLLMTDHIAKAALSIVSDTVLLPADCDLVKAMLSRGQDIAAEAETRRVEAEAKWTAGDADFRITLLGPPGPALWLTMSEEAMKYAGTATREAIKVDIELINAMTDRDLLDERIRTRRLTKGGTTKYKPVIVYSTIGFPEYPTLPNNLCKALKEIPGAEFKRGMAPQGWLEEELGEWV